MSTGPTDSVVAGRDIEFVVHLTEVVPLLECRLTISNSLGQPVTTLDSEAAAPADVRDPDLGPRIECAVRELPLAAGPLPRRRAAQGTESDPGWAAGGRCSSTSTPASSAAGRCR